MATKNPAAAPAETETTSGPTIEALQARVAELEQQLQAERQQAAAHAETLATQLSEVRSLVAERTLTIEQLLAAQGTLEAQLAEARRVTSPPPPAPPAAPKGRLHTVISPLDHDGKRYMPGRELHLTDEEAGPLLGHTVQLA